MTHIASGDAPRDASASVAARHEATLKALPFSDTRDFDDAARAHASFTLARSTLDEVIAKLTTFPEAVGAGKITFTGEPLRLGELMMLMDEFPRMFEIIEPKRTAVT